MKHAASRELYEYWDRVRAGAPAPRRSDIQPSDLRRILADTFILEVAGRERYVVRLAGTRVCALYGRELKATNFLDLFQADDRSAMATLTAAVTEDSAAAVVTVNAIAPSGRAVACELILLPLRHGGTAFDRILGSLAPLERPYWLGTEPVVRQVITSLRLIWPAEKRRFKRRRSDFPTLGAKPPPAFPLGKTRRHGHLFVVDGGKQ